MSRLNVSLSNLPRLQTLSGDFKLELRCCCLFLLAPTFISLLQEYIGVSHVNNTDAIAALSRVIQTLKRS